MVNLQQASKLLALMELELKGLNLWQDTPPSVEALSSREPFCCDTLSFEQWLQFVLIPRMGALIAGNHPLPTNIAVAPMAGEAFKPLGDKAHGLITYIAQFDALLSGGKHG